MLAPPQPAEVRWVATARCTFAGPVLLPLRHAHVEALRDERLALRAELHRSREPMTAEAGRDAPPAGRDEPAQRGADDALRAVVEALVGVALDQRQAARDRKDWQAADAIRDSLLAAGIHIDDTPDGPRWTIER